MSKQSSIKQEGKILEALGNSKFKVELSNGFVITCMVCGKMRKNFIRVIVGDKVEVELSPYDLTNGRISKRIRV